MRFLALSVPKIHPGRTQLLRVLWVATFDPMPWIEKLRMPILLIFGAEDRQQPTAQAVARWQLGLTRAGNSRVSTHVFPGADHRLQPAGSPAHGHSPKPKLALVDGVWLTIEAWVESWLTDQPSGAGTTKEITPAAAPVPTARPGSDGKPLIREILNGH